MKVLIADDEIKVCRLIQHLVDWDALEMDIVGFANDGKTAYESICEKKPDIVITDIRMPVYDGLELIRRAKEVNPEINFIVISGYSDDSKRRYLMGGSRYVSDNFGSGWSKTGDRSK